MFCLQEKYESAEKYESSTLCILVGQDFLPEYQKDATMSEFLTIKEVGLFLRLSAQSVKRLIREGRLTAHRIGKCSYRIPEEAVKVLLTQTLARKVNALEQTSKESGPNE